MRVEQFVERDPLVVHPDDSAGRAASLMTEQRLTALPVVDGQGQLAGMVRDTDILSLLLPDYLENLSDLGFIPGDLEPGSCTLSDVCRMPVKAALEVVHDYAVAENEPVLEAVRLMSKRCLTVLPVVRDGQLVGIIRAESVLRRIAELSQEAGQPS